MLTDFVSPFQEWDYTNNIKAMAIIKKKFEEKQREQFKKKKKPSLALPIKTLHCWV